MSFYVISFIIWNDRNEILLSLSLLKSIKNIYNEYVSVKVII